MGNPTVAIRIISSIRYFQLSGIVQFRYYYISLTNDEQLRTQLWDNGFKRAGGELSMGSFRDSAYSYVYVPNFELKDPDPGVALGNFSRTSVFFLHSYLTFLWFVKDNSVSYNEAISSLSMDDKHFFTAGSNYEVATNSKGMLETTYFTHDELMQAAIIYNQYQLITERKKQIVPSENTDAVFFETWKEGSKPEDLIDINIKDYNLVPLIERALTFIFSARTSPVLPNKLSLYMTALEAIFVPEGGGELQQKISERAAFYIGTKENKSQIFKTIQNAYRVRSKYVHGDVMPSVYKNIDALRLLCLQIDHITRQIFTKVVMVDSERFKDQKALEKYLSELIFQ